MRIVFIGGFASNKNQLVITRRELETFFGQRVEVIPLRLATHNPTLVKRLVKDAFVITHSAGILAVLHAKPKKVVVIAPPVPMRRLKLAYHGLLKTVYLLKDTATLERQQKIKLYHFHATKDLIRFLPFYLRLMKRVSIFDTIPTCITLAQKGVDITVAFMSRDSLFQRQSDGDLVPAKVHGIEIKTYIEGEHDELLLYPARVLEDIGITPDGL
jgi:hypothetical protein